MKNFGCLIYIMVVALIYACNSPYTPKRKGYFSIDFPAKAYQVFNDPLYPYSFEYPTYGHLVKDTTFFEEKAENDWWVNIDIPSLGGRLHVSYKDIRKNDFDALVNDSYKMAYKQHTIVATGIKDSLMLTPNGIEGIYFSLSGNTATANQFFLTDSTRHYLRGALYFDATPNTDSLGIVNDFLKEDLLHLINTLKWK